MSTAEIIKELPKLPEADRRAIREALLEIANQDADVALCDQAALGRNDGLIKWNEKTPMTNPREVWITDFGMAAKVRPALLLTHSPADNELDVATVLLHTAALRGNRWELNIQKRFLKPGSFTCSKSKPFDDQARSQAGLAD